MVNWNFQKLHTTCCGSAQLQSSFLNLTFGILTSKTFCIGYSQLTMLWQFQAKCKLPSSILLFAASWTIQSMEFSRPEYWSGQPFSSPRYLPNPGIKPGSPTLQVDSLPTKLSGKFQVNSKGTKPYKYIFWLKPLINIRIMY